MKTKRQNHYRGWKQALSVLLVFALAAGLVLGVPALSGVAYAAPILWDGEDEEQPEENGQPTGTSMLDWDMSGDEASSVTVRFGTDMTGEDAVDLKSDETVADLYLFAPAVRLSGYNVYAYCVDDGMPYYDRVEEYLSDKPNVWTVDHPTTAPDGYERPAWATGSPGKYLVFRYTPDNLSDLNNEVYVAEQVGLAELMAKVILAPQLANLSSGEVKITPASTGEIGEAQTGLPFGLYLNVVHDAKSYITANDYVVLAGPADSKEDAKVCTIAYSDQKVYTFQPQLLSLPTRDNLNTTAPGAWSYNMTVYTKGSAVDRTADLLIEKNLENFVVGKPVTFVFHVYAYTDYGETTQKLVYQKVVPLMYDAAGRKISEPITNVIPVGSTVVITEEYAGSTYSLTGTAGSIAPNREGGSAPALDFVPHTTSGIPNSIIIREIPAGNIRLIVPAQDEVSVERILEDGATETAIFTNTNKGTNTGGGSVVNSFTQDGVLTQHFNNAPQSAPVETPVNPEEEG